jgi:purine-binding chemotaxis protein CheW
MAEKAEKSTGEVVRVVNFCLGNEEFGADVALVREITKVADISHIPDAPSFIKGVINLRGQIVAVIDLARQFGLGQWDKDPDGARIMVTEVQEQTIGILVDNVLEVLKIPEENIEPAPELIRAKLGNDYIKGVGKLEDRLIIILDLEKVLALHEMKEVGKAGTPAIKE